MFAVELYEIQLSGGRYFLHEHPQSATSWHVADFGEFMSRWSLQRTVGDMCMHGMVSTDSQGTAPAKKPTGFLTNSEYIRNAVAVRCNGDHRHVQLMNG